MVLNRAFRGNREPLKTLDFTPFRALFHAKLRFSRRAERLW